MEDPIKSDPTYPDAFNAKHLDYMLEMYGGNREHVTEGFFWSYRFLITGSVSGDYLEFGVGNGRSFATAVHFGSKPNSAYGCGKFPPCLSDMRFIGFDSFEGLPEPYGVDAISGLQSDFVKGAYSATVDEVVRNLSKIGADQDRVILVPGWFEQTLTEETREKYGLKKAALVHIDCDLYESARLALDFITPHVVDGTVIMFDDYFCNLGNPKKGERRAFNEWQEKNPDISATEYRKYSTHGVSFVLNR